MDLTIFEVHLDDASFTANAPFSGPDEAESVEEDAAPAAADSDSGRPSVLPFVIGLAFLAAVGYLVRRRRNGGDDIVQTEIETEAPEPEAPTA